MSRAALFVLTACLASGGSAWAQTKSKPIALQNATIHPIEGKTITKGTVVIAGGKITAVGAAAQVKIPPGAQVVDLAGKHLYPGLIDANTVLGMTEIGSVLGTKDTKEVGRINPNLRAELAVNPDSALLPVARTGGVLLAHIVARSGLIAGTSALIYTQGWTHEDMTVRAPVFLHVRWPKMTVAPTGDVKKQVAKRERSLRALRSAFRNARAYWKAQEALGVLRLDEDLKWDAMRKVIQQVSGPAEVEEGAPLESAFIERAMRVAVHAEDVTQIEAALDWAKQERVNLVLVGGADAWRVAKKLRFADVPVILGRVFRLPRRRYERLHTPFQNAARLSKAGVRIAFGTGGNGFVAANARNLKRHAAQAIGHGLPKAAALRALTLGAAEILGVEHRLGSIEVGKEATLIATERELFDFRSKVTRAWIAGRAVSLRDRQLELYEKYRKRPRR